MVEKSLKDKTVSGTFWSAADAFLGQGVTFLVGLVLARLLTPEEYGLVGIVMIFTTVLLGVVDCGFSSSLIRKKEVADDEYSTLFYFNMITSVLLYSILYIAAPIISSFFERPQLINLIRVLGLILILQAFSIVQYTVTCRNIDFKTKTKVSTISSILSGAIGILLAYMGYGVWSLVFQQLAFQFLYSFCFWIFNRWRPSFVFNFNSFKYMFGYGWKMMLSGLLNNIWNQLYQVVVGKCYSPATLGQYTRARDFARIFTENISGIVQRVSFPVLSKIQDDRQRMIEVYRNVIKTTMFLTCVGVIWIGAVSEPLIYCVIGSQWKEAATYLPLICVTMSLYPMHAINLNMLQVLGRSDVFLIIEIIKKIIAVIPLVIGIFVGIYWMLLSSILLGIVSFFINTYYTGKELGYTSLMQIKDIAPDYGIALCIAIPVYFIKYIAISYWYILILQVAVGFAIGWLLCERLKLEEYIEVKELLVGLKNKCHVSK